MSTAARRLGLVVGQVKVRGGWQARGVFGKGKMGNVEQVGKAISLESSWVFRDSVLMFSRRTVNPGPA